MSDSSSSSPLTISNSIVAGNYENKTPGTAGTPNDLVPNPNDVLAVNYSLIGVSDGLTITGGNNLTGTAASPLAPLLGPLTDNGGPTLTHALLAGSPAIGRGNNALAVDENGNPLTTDQRGEDRILFGTVDIGAAESELEGAFLLGDANVNGVVNFLDIQPFIDLLASNTYLAQADIDGDGDVDFLDIQPFIDILASGGPAFTAESFVVAVPESSAQVLVSEPPSIDSVASAAEAPLTTETTRAKNFAPERATVSQKIAAAKPLTQSVDSVRYSFLAAGDWSLRVSESRGSLFPRRSGTPNTDRLELPLASLDENSAAYDSTEVAFSTAAELFDAAPDSLDEIFDFQSDKIFAGLTD